MSECCWAKEVAQELSVSVPSIRRAYWIAEIPAYRISKHAALRLGTSPANPFVQAVVEDHKAMQGATGGAAAGAPRRIAPVR